MCHSMRKKCVIRGTLALVLRLGRVMGVAPLRFESIEDGYRVSISNNMKIYSHLLITILSKIFYNKYNYYTRCLKRNIIFRNIFKKKLSSLLVKCLFIPKIQTLGIYFLKIMTSKCQGTHLT